MQIRKITATVAMLGIVASGAAQATLVDRGGGLLYDTVLNVTWLQDANYFQTTNPGSYNNGAMSLSEAKNFVSALVFNGYSDWRLPSAIPQNISFVGGQPDGSTLNGLSDVGFNITSPKSELAYMFYVNLGLQARYSETGVQASEYGVAHIGEQRNVGLVNNLQSYVYWYGTEIPGSIPNTSALAFQMYDGNQGSYAQISNFNVWAVRDGDVTSVATVPEPETYAMLLAGLGLMGAVARRKQK